MFIQPFLLQLPPETFHRGVIPAVPFSAHTADETVFFCHTPVHGYTDDLIPQQIHDDGKAELAFIRRDVSDVTYHLLSGPVSFEIPVQDIFCCRKSRGTLHGSGVSVPEENNSPIGGHLVSVCAMHNSRFWKPEAIASSLRSDLWNGGVPCKDSGSL